jgi:hypothetical protein
LSSQGADEVIDTRGSDGSSGTRPQGQAPARGLQQSDQAPRDQAPPPLHQRIKASAKRLGAAGLLCIPVSLFSLGLA